MEKGPDKWILNLEGLQNRKNEFRLKASISDKDFMIHVLNNLPKEYNMILDRLKNCLTASGDNVLTIDVIHKNESLEKIKSKKEEKSEKEAYKVL